MRHTVTLLEWGEIVVINTHDADVRVEVRPLLAPSTTMLLHVDEAEAIIAALRGAIKHARASRAV